MRLLVMIALLSMTVVTADVAAPELHASGQAPAGQAVLTPASAESDEGDNFSMRARESLLFGLGASTGEEYYDVVITRRPPEGVLIKLPYTRKGGRLTFDLHHRVGLSEDFGLPAEVMTVVEILTGSTTRMGTFTILDVIEAGATHEEEIIRASDAEVDRYVTPLGKKTITINTKPGPQSVSVVGRDVTITRGATTTRIDTPGIRMAMVSNIHFEAVNEINPLKKSGPGGE